MSADSASGNVRHFREAGCGRVPVDLTNGASYPPALRLL